MENVKIDRNSAAYIKLREEVKSIVINRSTQIIRVQNIQNTPIDFQDLLLTTLHIISPRLKADHPEFNLDCIRDRATKTGLISEITPWFLLDFPKLEYFCPNCNHRFHKHQEAKFKQHIFKRHVFIKETTESQKKEKAQSKMKEKCNFCDKLFISKSTLQIHIISIHTKEKPYRCSQCPKEYGESGRLRDHINKIHTREIQYPCPICPKILYCSEERSRHVNRMHAGETQCQICLKMCKNIFVLRNHRKLEHNNLDAPIHCEVCNMEFNNALKLKIHINYHFASKLKDPSQYNFICYFCDKRFPGRLNLETHFRMHTNERPYTCDHCSKGYKSESNLTQHLGYCNVSERKFICPSRYCGKSFKTKLNMNTHLKNNCHFSITDTESE